jgi:hypothetical protein
MVRCEFTARLVERTRTADPPAPNRVALSKLSYNQVRRPDASGRVRLEGLEPSTTWIKSPSLYQLS